MGCDDSHVVHTLAIIYFNPRTHRGVRRVKTNDLQTDEDISIHAPIVGCDARLSECSRRHLSHFNPRTHRGVRHKREFVFETYKGISIHAPIVGCDVNAQIANEHIGLFQSTHPSWGATLSHSKKRTEHGISIHAPIVGCDLIRQLTR